MSINGTYNTTTSGTITTLSGTNISTTGTTGTHQLIFNGGNTFTYQPSTTYYTYSDHLQLGKHTHHKQLRIIRNVLRRNKPLASAVNAWR